MKALKIIFGIIILIAAVFFMAGLVSPTLTYETSVVINHPLEKTFEIYNTPENLEKWMPGFISMKTIEEKPGVTGSQYEYVFDNQGQEMTIYETVTNYEENKLIEFDFIAGDMLKKDLITFNSENSNTTITNASTVTSNSYFYRCMFAFFKGMFKSIDQENLEKFKAFADKQ